MPLKLQEVQLEDFDRMIDHANIYNPGDDLIGPPTPVCWPVSSHEAAHQRLSFHMSKQKDRFLGDISANYLKIIDDSNEEIIAIARWHYYPTGYSYEKGIHWETHNAEGKSFPVTMNVELHNFILTARDSERKDWMAEGKPCWILMHLVTRPSQRGRGAAGMLIKWGAEKARSNAVPAYLEAGAMGRPLYEKHGFQQIGDLTSLDARPYGVDMDFVLTKMGIIPSK